MLLSAARQARAQIVTHHDTIPDFCATATIASVASGSWSNPSTWSPARVPAAGDVVRIASGTTVTFDTFMLGSVSCVGIVGTLNFSTTIPTRLWSGNIIVYTTGTLQVGTQSQPVPVGVTSEIVIADRPLDPINDPNQYGTGLIALGKVRMHGAIVAPTFVRLGQEPRAGNVTLSLSQAVTGWSTGDRLVIPDTRHMKWNEITNWSPTTPQWEELTGTGVSVDGRTLTLTAPLRYDHLGARDGGGALSFLPHVANLTRNVVVRSEVPFGSTGTRGHVMVTDRADVDIRYVAFRDLGRTTTAPLDTTNNHIGRYALHMHHLMGPSTTPSNGYQFTVIGNAFDGGSSANDLKWGVAIHNTHYGLVQGNIMYNWAGASLVTEDGSESFNVIDGNFAMRTRGTGDRLAEGTEGAGFWFRGPNNYVRNNVAANLWGNTTEAAYGYKYFMRYLGMINVPAFKGADTMAAGQYSAMDANKMRLLEFSNNEVYSAAQGLTYWWVNSQDPQPYSNAAESIVKDLRIWHVFNVGIYHYPAAKITFDGLVVRGKDPANAACCGRGFFAADYDASDIVFRNADIQGMITGIKPSTVAMGLQTVENSTMRNVTNIAIDSLFSVNGVGWIPPRKIIARNVRFSQWPGSGYKTVTTDWSSSSPTGTKDEILVYVYQGNPADNFRVYYDEQATQNIAGGLAPCTTHRPEIGGMVCPIPAETNPSPTPTTPPAAPTNVIIK